MDVVAGISLAASVMSLVDFGLRFTSSAIQISRSADGSSNANYELEAIATSINRQSKLLQAGMTNNSQPFNPDDAKYLESIRHLAKKSEDISKDLILHLQDLKARKSRENCDVPLTVMRTMLGAGRTKVLKENLDYLQQSLQFFLVAQMRYVSIP